MSAVTKFFHSLIKSISVDDFEDLDRIASWSGEDPFTHPVLPYFEGTQFNNLIMKDLKPEYVGLIRTDVKPSVDIKLDLRKKARVGETAIIDVKSSYKIVPNLSDSEVE